MPAAVVLLFSYIDLVQHRYIIYLIYYRRHSGRCAPIQYKIQQLIKYTKRDITTVERGQNKQPKRTFK